MVLPSTLHDKLNELSRKEGATLFMTLLAAYQSFLSRYTGQEDILVGSPIANRNYREIEGLIGFFVNTLVYRANLSGRPTFQDVLYQVRQKALKAYEYQDIPFENCRSCATGAKYKSFANFPDYVHLAKYETRVTGVI